MTKEKINRINELAKFAKQRELTAEEKTEREILRNEYRSSVRASLIDDLEHITIAEENK